MDVGDIVGALAIVFAAVALYAAARMRSRGVPGRRASNGYALLAGGAVVEAVNLFAQYSTTLAAVATGLLIAGLLIIAWAWRARPGRLTSAPPSDANPAVWPGPSVVPARHYTRSERWRRRWSRRGRG